MDQKRFWVFTEFNDERVEGYREWLRERFEQQHSPISYICGQQELCPDTGRKHIQGYAVFSKRRTMGPVKRLLGSDTVHVEVRRGTHSEAVEYCRKEESRSGEFIEFGEFIDRRTKGNTELDNVKKRLRDGESILEIADEHFGLWLRYNRGIDRYAEMVQPKRNFKTEVRVYWGRSGVGKSRRAIYEAGDDAYYKPKGEWWDGYDGVSNIIIDDFYGWISFDEMLRCTDRYKHRVPIKGGFVNFVPKLIIITSNEEPREWYSTTTINEYRFEALSRRLDKVEHMTEDWQEPDK